MLAGLFLAQTLIKTNLQFYLIKVTLNSIDKNKYISIMCIAKWFNSSVPCKII